MSIVSESRRAGPPQFGQATFTQSSAAPSGLVPLGFRSRPAASGRRTGQVALGHRHLAALGAVDDRDRRAPVPLARDEPVAQAEVLGGPARAALLEDLDDAADRVGLGEPVERSGVDEAPFAGQGDARRGRVDEREVIGQDRIALLVQPDHRDHARDRRVRVHHDAHGQLEGAREVEVALVVRRHRHDRAVAVVGQHVVGGPDRQALAVHGVHRVPVEEHAGLRALGRQPVDVALGAHRVEVVLEPGADLVGCPGRELRGELGVGRDDHERRAVERVGTRREHA